MKRLYLDHNATSPLREEARSVLLEGYGRLDLGNPSSAHAEGRRARRLLEQAREQLAEVLNCQRDEIVFTSGGTESNLLALGAAPAGRPLAVSAIEHPSLLAPARQRGALIIKPDGEGRLDPEAALRERPGLLSVGLANHEIGVIQDIRAFADAARKVGTHIHTDASQALGRMPLDLTDLGADLVTLSSHKLGGPVGVGALVVRNGLNVPPLMVGGGQEGGLRGGTEPSVLAAAFVAAALAATKTLDDTLQRWERALSSLRRRLELGEAEVVFHSPEQGGLKNTMNVSFVGRPGPSVVHRLDLEGVSVSHGSACASGSLETSPVLRALGKRAALAASSVRISLGPDDGEERLADFGLRLARVLDAVPVRVLEENRHAGETTNG